MSDSNPGPPSSKSGKNTKKVNIYPFAVELTAASGPLKGQVLSLNQTGFLVETTVINLKLGDKLECSFEIPMTSEFYRGQVCIVKLYSRAASQPSAASSPAPPPAGDAHSPSPAPTHGAIQMAEMHFFNPTPELIAKMMKFARQLAKAK